MGLISKTPPVLPKSGVASTLATFKTSVNLERIQILSDRFSFFVILLFLFSFAGQILIILNSRSGLPPEIPLYYSQEWGSQIMAPTLFIFLIPVITLFVFLVNFGLAFVFLSTNKFLIRTLLASVIVVSFANLVNVFKIISLLV